MIRQNQTSCTSPHETEKKMKKDSKERSKYGCIILNIQPYLTVWKLHSTSSITMPRISRQFPESLQNFLLSF